MHYTYRPARESDFPGYFALYRQQSIEDFGGCDAEEDEIHAEWHAPGFDLEKMMLLVFPDESTNATPVAYVEVRSFHSPAVRINSYGFVASEHRGRGIGTELVRRAEQMARAFFPLVPHDARIVIQNFSQRDDGKLLLSDCGHRAYRESFLMDIAFEEPPSPPAFPPGFGVRTLADGVTLRELIEVSRAAFKDHRGSVDEPIESSLATWEHLIESSARVYDPSLFVLLYDGATPAGEIILWTEAEEDAGKAFVQSLGVLPAYRRRGLATQLLYHGFCEAYRIGKRRVGLSVDGSSLTGANKLYEKAGMHIAHRFTAFEKELRPGVEMSNQG